MCTAVGKAGVFGSKAMNMQCCCSATFMTLKFMPPPHPRPPRASLCLNPADPVVSLPPPPAVSDACVEVGSLPSYQIELSTGLCPYKFIPLLTFSVGPMPPPPSPLAVSDACVEVGSLPSYSIELSSGLCPARGSHSVTFKGTPCGPGNSLVQWQAMSAPACGTTLARESLDPKQQADWVGQCGVPPMQISGLPTKICAPAELQQLSRRARRSRHTVAPPLQPWVTREAEKLIEPVPSTQSLGRATLAKGESTTNWGMTRIGARSTGLFRGGRSVWGGGGCAGGGLP
jgi:hypothetical protein